MENGILELRGRIYKNNLLLEEYDAITPEQANELDDATFALAYKNLKELATHQYRKMNPIGEQQSYRAERGIRSDLAELKVPYPGQKNYYDVNLEDAINTDLNIFANKRSDTDWMIMMVEPSYMAKGEEREEIDQALMPNLLAKFVPLPLNQTNRVSGDGNGGGGGGGGGGGAERIRHGAEQQNNSSKLGEVTRQIPRGGKRNRKSRKSRKSRKIRKIRKNKKSRKNKNIY